MLAGESYGYSSQSLQFRRLKNTFEILKYSEWYHWGGGQNVLEEYGTGTLP